MTTSSPWALFKVSGVRQVYLWSTLVIIWHPKAPLTKDNCITLNIWHINFHWLWVRKEILQSGKTVSCYSQLNLIEVIDAEWSSNVWTKLKLFCISKMWMSLSLPADANSLWPASKQTIDKDIDQPVQCDHRRVGMQECGRGKIPRGVPRL